MRKGPPVTAAPGSERINRTGQNKPNAFEPQVTVTQLEPSHQARLGRLLAQLARCHDCPAGRGRLWCAWCPGGGHEQDLLDRSQLCAVVRVPRVSPACDHYPETWTVGRFRKGRLGSAGALDAVDLAASAKTGTTCFSGFMGDVQVLMFRGGEITRPNGEVGQTWRLFVQERDPERRAQQKREQRADPGQHDTGDPGRPFDDGVPF
jgi:hypothetical protein